MTENKIGHKDNDKRNEVELEKDNENEKTQQHNVTQKEQQPKTETHDSRFRRLSQFLDLLNIPRHHTGHSGSSSSSNNSQQHSPQTPHAAREMPPAERRSSNSSGHNNATSHDAAMTEQDQEQEKQQQQPQPPQQGAAKRSSCVSFRSEILLFDLVNGEINEFSERSFVHKDDCSSQRVYKKTSPNCVLTMYLTSREIILSGNSSSKISGIVFFDPKVIQGYRVFAQLALTFRYGREDEEVMGLRFCNEAITALCQVWPRKEELNRPQLSPLQEALLKRLGEGAHPFTLTLTAQAPPSVQLVPAKRYYGAPIGTSYHVRCYVAERPEEKSNRRASVKMGVRVLYQTDVHNQFNNVCDTTSDLTQHAVSSPACTNSKNPTSSPNGPQTIESQAGQQADNAETAATSSSETRQPANKPRKSERGDSFPKLRLSPKTFRFSGRFGRSKSEVDKCHSDAFYNYSKSFHEYDCIGPVGCSGPQAAVDKPFLLQDGRVSLRASLDKAWYSHGEDVYVTIHIRNDSKKTVRKIRVCAIQHVDVCMFNNGKFKNVVADSDNITPLPFDQPVAPGANLTTTVILRPQRGPTKNWIALEDTLQRTTEPDEINASIAASAVRTPHFLMQSTHSPSNCTSSPIFMAVPTPANPTSDERNVFAIYVSYYVKVKLTLSGMGGDLSLKLPFMLVHVDEKRGPLQTVSKLNLEDVPASKRNGSKTKSPLSQIESSQESALGENLDRIESVAEATLTNEASQLHVGDSGHSPSVTVERENKEYPLKYLSSETLAQNNDAEECKNVANNNEENQKEQKLEVRVQVHSNMRHRNSSSLEEDDFKFCKCRKELQRSSSDSKNEDIQATVDETANLEIIETSLASIDSPNLANTNV